LTPLDALDLTLPLANENLSITVEKTQAAREENDLEVAAGKAKGAHRVLPGWPAEADHVTLQKPAERTD
jgi:hypothetical protein